MKSDVNKLHLDCTWQELTEGMQIYGEKPLRLSIQVNGPQSSLKLTRKNVFIV